MKKFLLILLAATVVTGLLLFQQIKKSADIVTQMKAAPIISANAIDLPIDKTDPILGNPGAPLTIVEFIDLGNSRARKIHTELADFVSAHPLDARLIWKDAPSHSIFSFDATLAHQAAFCAGKQNKFWPFVAESIKNSGHLTEAGLKDTAAKLKLDVASWWDCANSTATTQKIKDAVDLLPSLSVNSAPAIFINNKKVNLDENIDLTQMLGMLIAK